MHAVTHPSEEFRGKAGQRDWAAIASQAEDDEARGPGLYEIDGDDPARRWITNVRKLAGRRREKRAQGSVLIGAGGWMLALLGAGLFAVSFAGQYKYIFAARGGVDLLSAIEAGMLDLGMIIFTVLALGLARAGKPARVERALILACAIGSAGMNYAAADVASPRSVVAFVAPPVFLAVVVDRVVAVIRRHVLGNDEPSPWAAAGRLLRGLVRAAGLVALYLLRLLLDPKGTVPGLRRVVLNAAPLPEAPVKVIAITAEPEGGQEALDEEQRRELDEPERPGTKKAALLALYRAHPKYGDRKAASQVTAELAGPAGYQVDAKGQSGSARNIIYAELAALAARQQQDGEGALWPGPRCSR